MVRLTICMRARPEKAQELVQTLSAMAEAIRRSPGCAGCDLLRSAADADEFCLFEEWTCREHLDDHLQSELFGALLGATSLLERPHEIKVFTGFEASGAAMPSGGRATARDERGGRERSPAERWNRAHER